MIRGKFISNEIEKVESEQIIKKVFKDKSYNIIDLSKEQDEFYLDVLVYESSDENLPVATGRMVLKNEKEIELTRIAVLEKYRNLGFGDVTVRMLVNHAFMKGFYKIKLVSPLEATSFFEKLGFKKILNVNLCDNITCIPMEYGYNELIKPCSSAN